MRVGTRRRRARQRLWRRRWCRRVLGTLNYSGGVSDATDYHGGMAVLMLPYSSYFVGLCCVFVCVHLRTFLVGRPSHLCVCRVGTPPARKYI